jgi:hypothetical protein
MTSLEYSADLLCAVLLILTNRELYLSLQKRLMVRQASYLSILHSRYDLAKLLHFSAWLLYCLRHCIYSSLTCKLLTCQRFGVVQAWHMLVI